MLRRPNSLRLGISEGEEVMLSHEKIDQLDSFTYLDSIIRKEGGRSEDVKGRIVNATDCPF